MATSRSLGRISLTTSPSISIVPSSTSSSPAIVLSNVLLPQPDGPTNTVNSPSGMSRSIPRTACTGPNRLCSALTLTVAINCSLRSTSQGAERQSAHEMALYEHAENDGRRERCRRQRAGFAILRALKAEEGAKDRRQREGVAAGQDQREKEFRPYGDEHEHRGGGHAGRGERHGDHPKRLPAA